MPLDLEKKIEIKISLLCLKHLNLEKFFQSHFFEIKFLCYGLWLEISFYKTNSPLGLN